MPLPMVARVGPREAGSAVADDAPGPYRPFTYLFERCGAARQAGLWLHAQTYGPLKVNSASEAGVQVCIPKLPLPM